MSFNWIDNGDTGFTALGATTISDDDLEISGIFVGETEEVSFRLGNLGSSTTTFDISASGVNSTIIDDVEFSYDNGLSWDTTAHVSGVRPNECTDLIRCRYTPAEGEITGVGSFLIRVDES